MLTLEKLEPAVTSAFAKAMVAMAGEGTDLPDSLPDLAHDFGRLKAEHGRQALAERVGLHEAEFVSFDAAVRDVLRTLAHVEKGDLATERNALLSQVRLLSWLETMGERRPALAPDRDRATEALLSEDVGRKQVRALELIVRSLITESYADQAALTGRLEEALSETIVRRWKQKADAGDILSGLTFSELASLFVSKDEFPRYEGIYEDTLLLSLLKQKRRTLQVFLDDVRRIRNVLAHNKQISNTQLTLLDLYYEEIVSPVQTAFDTGETKVDPATYLDVSRDEMEGWVGGLHDDVQSVKDDLGELRQSLMASLGEIHDDTKAIRHTTRGVNRKVIGIAAGVALLLVGTAFLLLQGGKTQDEVDKTRASVERTEAISQDTAADVDSIRDTTEATAEATRAMASDVEETKEATTKTAERVEEATDAMAHRVEKAAETSEEAAATTTTAAERVEDAATSMAETSARVAQTLEELRDGFVALTKQGGIIANATRPQEHYHNARLYQQRGDVAQAMQSYRDYMSFADLEFVDPHLRYQSLLRLQVGKSGAREVYHDLKTSTDNPVVAFAWSLLLDGPHRAAALETHIEAHPLFAPAYYALSRDYSVARLGSQSLEDKRQEKRLLEAFLALKDEGTFLEHYLDQAVASEQLEDAAERFAAVSLMDADVLENPVRMTGQHSNSGWRIVFSIPDTVKEIFYRFGTEGEFKSTGVRPEVRTFLGLPQVNWSVAVGRVTEVLNVQVKYVDARDRLHGPYHVSFDPVKQLVTNSKRILESLKRSWVVFAGSNASPSLNFVGLLSWRAALETITYGVNRETPDTDFPFRAADPKAPNNITVEDTMFANVPRNTKFVTIRLTYKDGTMSEIVRFDR